VIGLGFAFVSGLQSGPSAPGADDASPLLPHASRRRDQAFARMLGLVTGVVFWRGLWAVCAIAVAPAFGLAVGAVSGLAFGFILALTYRDIGNGTRGRPARHAHVCPGLQLRVHRSWFAGLRWTRLARGQELTDQIGLADRAVLRDSGPYRHCDIRRRAPWPAGSSLPSSGRVADDSGQRRLAGTVSVASACGGRDR